MFACFLLYGAFDDAFNWDNSVLFSIAMVNGALGKWEGWGGPYIDRGGCLALKKETFSGDSI